MQSSEQLAKLIDDLIQGGRHQGLGPQLAYSSIEDGKIVEHDINGVQVSSWGKQHDGTHTVVSYVGPTPPVPVPATVNVTPGSAEIRWSGKFVEDAVSPLDLKHISVHILDSSSDTVDLSDQRATIRGELGDVATLLFPLPGIFYVRLVAWTLSGKYSEPSTPVPLDVPFPADAASVAELYDTVIPGLEERLDNAAIAIDEAATNIITDSRFAPNSLGVWPFQEGTIPSGSIGTEELADFSLTVRKLQSNRHHIY